MAGNLRQRLGGMFSRKPKNDGTSEVVKREENSREAVINELRQGYTELVDTMAAVRTHMADQAQRSDRIIEVIEQLPEVMRSIPESNHRQNETLAGLTQSLQTQNHSTQELTRALGGLADATRQQEQSLAGMHDRLNNTLSQTEAVNHEMAAGIDKVTGAIEGVHEDQRTGREVLAEIAGQSQRQQKHLMAMTGITSAVAIAALCIAGYVAVMASRSSNIAGRDVEAAAPAGQTPAAEAGDDADDTAPLQPAGEANVEAEAEAEAEAGIEPEGDTETDLESVPAPADDTESEDTPGAAG
ncbi:MAG: hypothetical protein AAGA29_14700 [Planctomycetota bacterium]